VVRAEERSAVVSVSDTGLGFSAAALEHALERFWHETVPGAAPEHGLGLAIARAIVSGYGGSIELSNAPAGGAVVSIHLDKDPSQR
jgi:signal transduction histidine kinase